MSPSCGVWQSLPEASKEMNTCKTPIVPGQILPEWTANGGACSRLAPLQMSFWWRLYLTGSLWVTALRSFQDL